MRSFQRSRGLRADAACGPQTWSSLVEAGYHLGDRLLYHRAPPLRGDDVAALQRRLGALGFDAGRVDGIFGIRTAGALTDFQRNAGLTTDGICGPSTVGALARLGAKSAGRESVAALRERETRRRGPRTLDSRRLALGTTGGLDALTDALTRRLADRGAVVVALHESDGSEQASQANAFDAELFLGLGLIDMGCRAAYYGTEGFESSGGRDLAGLLCAEIPGVLGEAPVERCPMSLPVLRETRMPAVLCEVGPPSLVVARTAELAEAISRAVVIWAEAPEEV